MVKKISKTEGHGSEGKTTVFDIEKAHSQNADMQRSKVRRRARECNFSELPPELLAKLCC